MKIKQFIKTIGDKDFVIITPIMEKSVTKKDYAKHKYIRNYYVKTYEIDQNIVLILAKKHRLERNKNL